MWCDKNFHKFVNNKINKCCFHYQPSTESLMVSPEEMM